MPTTTSKDGTTIAFDRLGEGPAVVLIGGGPGDRTSNAPLAELLADRFSVLNYDRRGRGESGDAPDWTPDREYEDLAAVIAEAGGSAALIGNSGTGNIALEAAARGLPVTRLALWEPPSSSRARARPSRPTGAGGSTSSSPPAAPATRSSTG